MTIQHFINSIPETILNRGRAYLINGNILDLNKTSDGTWYAEVEGNYGNYEVLIKFDRIGQVEMYDCDCPYEGNICKHIAAVAMAIEEEMGSDNTPSDERLLEDSWEKLIQDAKPEELTEFLIDHGRRNRDFRHQVKIALSKPDIEQNADNIPYYRKLIKETFDKYEDRGGYIDYHNSFKAMSDIAQFRIKADDYCTEGHYNEAFCVCAALITEGIEAIQYMDDSMGGCGDAISDSFLTIDKILKSKITEELREKIFTWLYKQVQNPDYSDYGSDDILEPLFYETATSLNRMDIAFQFLDETIIHIEKKPDGWSNRHDLENRLSQKVNLLKSINQHEEAEKIIDNNIQFRTFRQLRVDKALSEKKIKQAENLILEGIKIAKKNNEDGTAHRWKDQLLDLYKRMENNSKYNKLARELFVENTSDMKYYRLFKQTSKKEDWSKTRDKLISELKKKKNNYYYLVSKDDLASIYIEEDMTEELFEIVKSSNRIDTIIRYTKYLKDIYPSELLEYYKAAIEIQAQNTGRNVYIDLIGYLREMSKIKGGLVAAKELKNDLLNQYKNRPAMKEEFRKLNWD